MPRIALIIPALLLVFACAGKTPVKTSPEEFNPEVAFEKANKLIDDKDYAEARALLLEIKNRDLTKKYAPLAQLRIADAYVKEDETELAVAEYRRFIELYPDHRHAPYAQYQIAMVYFNQIESPERGYGGAAKALAEFEKLKRDYPRNPYKDVVELRIEKCRNTMADYEFLVGEFYLKRGSYNAAIGRFETLLKKFPDYKKEENVLLNLGIAYKNSGDTEKAELYLNRLIEKYPNSRLAGDAKKELSSLKKAATK
ncbi:MAG: outer membrane protein assembly factor BamD [Nitrospirota bacterium]|nr:outer membrane protein assembly factor BamD [Nitrospirota bacterium]